MDLIMIDSVLQTAGYRTWSVGEELYFEDDTILGFASVHDSVADLLGTWADKQESFLRDNAAALRSDRTKAWNVYSVFLSSKPAAPEEQGELQAIEQDFRSTRKIARAGMTTQEHVRRALVPILPLPATVLTETTSPDEQLAAKLDAAQAEFLERLSNESTTDEEIIEWLLTES